MRHVTHHCLNFGHGGQRVNSVLFVANACPNLLPLLKVASSVCYHRCRLPCDNASPHMRAFSQPSPAPLQYNAYINTYIYIIYIYSIYSTRIQPLAPHASMPHPSLGATLDCPQLCQAYSNLESHMSQNVTDKATTNQRQPLGNRNSL